jgi:hypothetical protein
MEYIPNFDLSLLSPSLGQTVSVYVDARFLSFFHPPIVDREIYGGGHYSPNSDIAAIVMHSGAVFVHPSSRDSRHRQFCRVVNVREVMCCPEKEYLRLAEVEDIPNDLAIRGVLLVMLFCSSPSCFPSWNRNGVRSREAPGGGIAMGIADFRIFSNFDRLPTLVRPSAVTMKFTSVPEFCYSFTGEFAARYGQEFFAQVFALPNILNGLFSAYRVFFDVENCRYEILLTQIAGDGGPFFQVVRLVEPVSLDFLKRRTSVLPVTEPVGEEVSFWDVWIEPRAIAFGTVVFDRVSHVSLFNMFGRLPRNGK